MVDIFNILKIYKIPRKDRRTHSAEIDELRQLPYGSFVRQAHCSLFPPSMTIGSESIDPDYLDIALLCLRVVVDSFRSPHHFLSSITHIYSPARFCYRNTCLCDNRLRRN